ncbi:MAG: chromosomal replication initiator protein DnaA [candidate division WOR-3 bacterium]|nr:chromosomal replication initiator protein DnaA [candidate division WOR-3 bacterium]
MENFKFEVLKMERDKEAIWKEILLCLSELINKNAFATWFEPLKPISFDDNTLVLGAPNNFFIEWISEYYMAPLTRVLSRQDFNGLKIDFRVHQDQEVISERTPTERFTESNRTSSNNIQKSSEGTRLIPRFSFENFIVGESNRFAFAAAKAVAAAPAKAYNPLFIYGGVGLGKTHLLHALGNYVKQNQPNLKIYYTPAEQLFLDLIQSIQERNTSFFTNKYRNLDLLLLDDIHYLKGKERLQEDVFHLFNHLQNMGKQIVFTSDRPPKEIPTLEERLVSRLLSGLVCDLKPPDIETRIAILNNRAKIDGINVSPEIIFYIAENIKTNIRELEGALIRVSGFATLTNTPLTIEVCKKILADLQINKEPPKPIKIIESVAKYYGLTLEQLQSKERTASIALARQVAMYFLRTFGGMSLKEIGAYFGGKDHSTVIHAIEKITTLRKSEESLSQDIQKITMLINGG